MEKRGKSIDKRTRKRERKHNARKSVTNLADPIVLLYSPADYDHPFLLIKLVNLLTFISYLIRLIFKVASLSILG